jgi:hypothetical protein
MSGSTTPTSADSDREGREVSAAKALQAIDRNADCYSVETMRAEVIRLEKLIARARLAVEAI